MANIKYSALSELTTPADGDLFAVDDISEVATEKTKKLLFSTLRKAAMADADADTKITTDASADEDIIRFYTGAGGQQIYLSDGSLKPAVDNDVDIGSSANRFKIAAFVKYFITSTFYASFPTNGVAADAKIMIGDSNTIAWFYNNTAPPGWKVYGVADYVLRTGATGGVTGGNWTISGQAASGNASGDHTHTGPAHTHTVSGSTPASNVETYLDVVGNGATTSSSGTGATGGQSATHTHTAGTFDGTWRPLGYIGKLYQLDTA